MNFCRLLKFGFVGFTLQVVMFILGAFVSLPLPYLYLPWVKLGDFVFPPGPGLDALPEGAILGFFVGVSVYSLLIGVAICYFRQRSKTLK